eukprot:CAMPEP_0172505090 /NCGR_PEP_ID=MMETSP1066-20121228/183618_1 /TAXON_ID=671091 /ORGANISM="Coscinodiscus wailesii, Strain CCMP2513" /LENGTH=58 /DNA_ID=CAMNT_0013281563 /DNA_START=27 /DNA_END=199 /DNA_ORIENTATION=+
MNGTTISSTTPPSTAPFQHGFKAGDHVVRWSHIMLYPIQVHGIVMSSIEDVVTLVDFG